MNERHSERGAQVLELAMVVPVLLLIFGGIAEFGFLFRSFEVTTNAAREGARLAALPGNEADDYAIVRALVDGYLEESRLSGPHTTTIAPEPIAVGALTAGGVRVTVDYTYDCLFLGPIAGMINGTFADTITFQSAALMRVQVAAVGP